MNRSETLSIDQEVAADDTIYRAYTEIALKPVSDSSKNDTTSTSVAMQRKFNTSDMMEKETGKSNLTTIRQRNAMYSKRKYYKKKRYIEKLRSSKYQLVASNKKLRENNEQLESMVRRANQVVAFKERSGAIISQDQTQLQDLLLFQHQHPVQARGANDTMASLQQFLSYDAHQNVEMIPSASLSAASLQNLAIARVKTAISRQALQRGLPIPVPNNITSRPSTLQHPYLHTGLTNLSPNLTQIELFLLQQDLNNMNANQVTASQDRMRCALFSGRLSDFHRNDGNSNIAILQHVQSLQDQQQAIRYWQQIALANDQEQERQTRLSVFVANALVAHRDTHSHYNST